MRRFTVTHEKPRFLCPLLYRYVRARTIRQNSNFLALEGSFTQTLNLSRKQKISMRLAALSLGVSRVREAKQIRGLFP
ncbi:MAG: hypothetical protein HY298_02975 [Verrucomicrobia bacterium]|nr:hypothetical protein [Verrucomicrobiota bacterium]